MAGLNQECSVQDLWTPHGEDLGCVRFLNDVGYPYACDLLGVYRDSEHTYAALSDAKHGLLQLCNCSDLDSLRLSPPLPRREICSPGARCPFLLSVQEGFEEKKKTFRILARAV